MVSVLVKKDGLEVKHIGKYKQLSKITTVIYIMTMELGVMELKGTYSKWSAVKREHSGKVYSGVTLIPVLPLASLCKL